VNLSPLATGLSQTAGPDGGGGQLTITGQNFSGAAGQLRVLFGTTPATSVNIVSDTSLIVTVPAHSAGTVDVRVQTPYGTSATSAAMRYTYLATISTAQIVGRRLFYNQSGTAAPLRYDGNNAAINANDDLAIATNKSAYLPGSGAATFANVSSYAKGINGVMLDLQGVHGAITATDFEFRIGNNNTPSTWATAPAPISLSVRAGAGVSGSDRLTLVWANGAIKNTWLQVTVKSNANTNLVQKPGYPAGVADVFYFGSAVGDSGQGDTATSATVNATDELAARNNPAGLTANIPVTNLFDYNRDARVDTSDALIARNNPTTAGNVVRFISIGNPPAAPQVLASAAFDDSLLASALAAPQGVSSEPAPRRHVMEARATAFDPPAHAFWFQQLGETIMTRWSYKRASRTAPAQAVDSGLGAWETDDWWSKGD
jgi:hypothetical protein